MFSCICPLKLFYHCNSFFLMHICFNKTAVQAAKYSVAGGGTALSFALTMRQPQQGCTKDAKQLLPSWGSAYLSPRMKGLLRISIIKSTTGFY